MNDNLISEKGLIEFNKSDDIVSDLKNIIDLSQKQAYQAVNTALVYRNWLIGYRIAEEELKGEDRAEFGAKIIKQLSKELTEIYGKGFDRSNLYHFLKFYQMFPQIVDTVCRQFSILLSWSHYRVLLQVNDKKARDWYEKEAIEQTWSVRTLQRNISSQYYYRLLKSQVKEPVIEEMKQLTGNSKYDKLDFYQVILYFLKHNLN